MQHPISLLAILISWHALVQSQTSAAGTSDGTSDDILDYVNPLIGTDNGGNVFAGATRPFSIAKAVADVSPYGQNTAGFSSDGSPVTGFSSLHDMGTGGNPSLGNFPLFPELCPGDDINKCVYPKLNRMVSYDNSSVVAKPGYFAVNLTNGIGAEMAVGERAALYRFTFPNVVVDNSSQYSNESMGSPAPEGQANVAPLLLLDLTDLWDSRQNATISIDPATGRMIGNATFLPSFGAGSYVQHFCADFSSSTEMTDNGMHVNSRAGSVPKNLSVTRGFNLFYVQAGGWIRFEPNADGDETVVHARMGISYVSVDQACRNAENDIPTSNFSSSNQSDWNMDALVEETQSQWRQKLSPITIKSGEGVSKDLLTSFYSAMYRTMVNPQNMTGENPLWQSNEPYFDSTYCFWDDFRTAFPFLTIVDPAIMTEVIRSAIDIQRHLGWLPDCRMSLCKGWTQGGSNADVVITDAYLKNLTANIDWQAALTAVIKDAEIEPLEWSYEGRGGLMSWHQLGYIPYLDYDYLGVGVDAHSVSRTLEYAYNDFCIGSLGQQLGLSNYTTYLSRSSNWYNLFKPDQNSSLMGNDTGFTGFFQPKFLNGSFGFQDPTDCSTLSGVFCSLTSDPSETFESSIWEYQFFVPHAVSSLIDTLGGVDRFIARLDFAYETGLLDISNEPAFLMPYLYHYAGRPGLSAKMVHNFIPSSFNASISGLPGNDDSGTMSAFTTLSMMGLFPNAGQNVYFIVPPFFEELNVTNGLTGNTASIKIVNDTFDPGYDAIYVQSAVLNGKAYRRNWIGHEFFLEGMTLELEVGTKESDWGTRPEDLPPSLTAM